MLLGGRGRRFRRPGAGGFLPRHAPALQLLEALVDRPPGEALQIGAQLVERLAERGPCPPLVKRFKERVRVAGQLFGHLLALTVGEH